MFSIFLSEDLPTETLTALLTGVFGNLFEQQEVYRAARVVGYRVRRAMFGFIAEPVYEVPEIAAPEAPVEQEVA